MQLLNDVAVHVDVDFINPFVTSVKKASRDVWLQLPPPVRQAGPRRKFAMSFLQHTTTTAAFRLY